MLQLMHKNIPFKICSVDQAIKCLLLDIISRCQLNRLTIFILTIFSIFSIGTGEASVTLNTRTKGSKPILPEKNRFIELSSHSITLHLEAWNDGGCHMSHFVVENKRK